MTYDVNSSLALYFVSSNIPVFLQFVTILFFCSIFQIILSVKQEGEWRIRINELQNKISSLEIENQAKKTKYEKQGLLYKKALQEITQYDAKLGEMAKQLGETEPKVGRTNRIYWHAYILATLIVE